MVSSGWGVVCFLRVNLVRLYYQYIVEKCHLPNVRQDWVILRIMRFLIIVWRFGRIATTVNTARGVLFRWFVFCRTGKGLRPDGYGAHPHATLRSRINIDRRRLMRGTLGRMGALWGPPFWGPEWLMGWPFWPPKSRYTWAPSAFPTKYTRNAI